MLEPYLSLLSCSAPVLAYPAHAYHGTAYATYGAIYTLVYVSISMPYSG